MMTLNEELATLSEGTEMLIVSVADRANGESTAMDGDNGDRT